MVVVDVLTAMDILFHGSSSAGYMETATGGLSGDFVRAEPVARCGVGSVLAGTTDRKGDGVPTGASDGVGQPSAVSTCARPTPRGQNDRDVSDGSGIPGHRGRTASIVVAPFGSPAAHPIAVGCVNQAGDLAVPSHGRGSSRRMESPFERRPPSATGICSLGGCGSRNLVYTSSVSDSSIRESASLSTATRRVTGTAWVFTPTCPTARTTRTIRSGCAVNLGESGGV